MALLTLLGLNVINESVLLQGRVFGFLTLRFCWLPIMGGQRSHAVLLQVRNCSHEIYVISEWLIFVRPVCKLPCKLHLICWFHPTVENSIASDRIHILVYRTRLCSWETIVSQSLLTDSFTTLRQLWETLLTRGEVTCHTREPVVEQQFWGAAESIEEQSVHGVRVSTAGSTWRGWRQRGHRDVGSPEGYHVSSDSSHSTVQRLG